MIKGYQGTKGRSAPQPLAHCFRLDFPPSPAIFYGFARDDAFLGGMEAGREVAEPVQVRLCFHDRCFDGAASAAVFYRFFRERVKPGAEFHFTGMTHRARQPFEPGLFDGDENVIVDFKYSSSPRVTWWFDHHQSAFLTTPTPNTSSAIAAATNSTSPNISPARSSWQT